MKKLKVLLLSPHGSGEHYHGTATASYRLYASDPDRFDVTLLHGSAVQEPSPIFNEIVCPRVLTGKPLNFALWFPAVRKWMRANAHRFDVLHAVVGFHIAMSPAHYAETELGLPAVVKIANHNNDLLARGGWKALFGLGKRRQKMATEVSAMVGLSHEIREELRGYGVTEDRLFSIPNPANLTRFKAATPEVRAQLRNDFGLNDSKVIVYSGELVARKRPHLLLEALGIAVKKGLDWRVLFVGPEREGKYGEGLYTLMEELGIRDRVKMLGFRKDVEVAYQAADITCLPSTNEAMPSAVVEAMATGMPAILTDYSSTSELVTSDALGKIVDPNGEAIFNALEEYLENPERLSASSAAAKEHITKNFDVRVVLDKYEEAFRWAIANPAHASS